MTEGVIAITLLDTPRAFLEEVFFFIFYEAV